MSATGNCYDNAVAESFFHKLKIGIVHDEKYFTRSQAARAIFEYVQVFYNRQRIHSSIGYMTPVQFEARWQKNHPNHDCLQKT